MNYSVKHLLTASVFTREMLGHVFRLADYITEADVKAEKPLSGKSMLLAFFSDSTRTFHSFEKAGHELGMHVSALRSLSQLATLRGESLEDVFRVLSILGYEYIVIRHPQEYFPHRIAEVIDEHELASHVINAGDGWNEHPCQALGDLYTIYKLLGDIDRLRILFVGDIKHHRVLHSLIYLLSNYPRVGVYTLSPKELELSKKYREVVERSGVKYEEYHSDNILPLANIVKEKDINVIYILPFIPNLRYKYREMKLPDIYDLLWKFNINSEIIEKIPKDTYIMHPLPRHGMLSPELDKDKRAIYFKQVVYNYIIKQALLLFIEGVKVI